MNRFIRKTLFVVILSTIIFTAAIPAAAAITDGNFVTIDDAALREAPSISSEIILPVPEGSNITLLSHDPAGWSRIKVGNTEGFILSEAITFPEENAPVKFRTTSTANMRYAPDTQAQAHTTIGAGYDILVLTHDPAGWSYVKFDDDIFGFVRSDLLQVVIYGTQQIISTPISMQTVNTTQTIDMALLMDSPNEDADIIYELNIGTTVEVLNDLTGWSKIRFNGSIGYIRANSLSSRHPGNVELLTMAQVRHLLSYQTDVTLTDVRTGKQFNVKIFAMGRHADVVTSTPEDTAIKYEIREGVWSWAARPVWVHIGDRTIAASINGMPHPYNWLPESGLGGHVCLHFHGTITRNQRYQADLRAAIAEAYAAAQNW